MAQRPSGQRADAGSTATNATPGNVRRRATRPRPRTRPRSPAARRRPPAGAPRSPRPRAVPGRRVRVGRAASGRAARPRRTRARAAAPSAAGRPRGPATGRPAAAARSMYPSGGFGQHGGPRRAGRDAAVEAVVDRGVEDQGGGQQLGGHQRREAPPLAQGPDDQRPGDDRAGGHERPASHGSPASSSGADDHVPPPRALADRQRAQRRAREQHRGGDPGVIVVEAATAGGESPTSPTPTVAHGSGTMRRASAAASTNARASIASICHCTARAPPSAYDGAISSAKPTPCGSTSRRSTSARPS